MFEVTQLDLDQPITREQYEHAVSGMIEFMTGTLSERHGWCGERHRYFTAVVPEYRRGLEGANFDTVPQDANYAKRLKDTRSKILWYTYDGEISLADANDIFRHGGLPEYGTDEKLGGHRVRIALPYLDINVSGAESSEQAQAWAKEHMLRVIVDLLDGKPVEDSRYVPASGVFDMSYGGANTIAAQQEREVRIEDTMHPHHNDL